jgi:hypothetical protein
MLPLLYSVSIIVGLGLLNIKEFLTKRFSLSSKFVISLLIICIILSSAVKIFQKERIEKLKLKVVAHEIAKSVSYEEVRSCSKEACKDLVLTIDPRVLFYLSNITKVPLCPTSEDRFSYNNLGSKSVDEIINFIKSKGYRIVILEREVFKEKMEILREEFRKLGVKVYVL